MVVMGVAETGNVLLEMAVVIAVVTSVTRLLRTLESMDRAVAGSSASLLPLFCCLRALVAIVCFRCSVVYRLGLIK